MKLRLAIVACLALALTSAADAGVIVDKRLGNNTEGITAVSRGGDDWVVVVDGYDVFALRARGGGDRVNLFSLKSIHWGGFPSGIAWVPTERAFVFDDQGDLTHLQVVSPSGAPLGARAITFTQAYPAEDIVAAEGLAYLPSSAPWPDALARAAWFPDDENPAHIEIVSRGGTVLQEIPVALPPEHTYITAVAYVPNPAGFLVATGENEIWRVALDGSIVAAPTPVADTAGIEGLATLSDGRVYAAEYARGVLVALDPSLARDPSADRPYEIGVGITRAFDGFWDSSRRSWMLLGLDRRVEDAVFVVSPTLDAARLLFHTGVFASGLSRAPGGNVATCLIGNPARGRIAIFSETGTRVSTIEFGAIAGMPNRMCITVAYVPSIDAFAVNLRGAANRNKIFLVSPLGTLVDVITAPGVVGLLSTSPDDPNTLLVVGPVAGAIVTYDATQRTIVSTRPLDVGPLVSPFGFIAGPRGSYASLDGSNSEMAIFR